MKMLTDPKHTPYFDTLDKQIQAETDKTIVTYKKDTVSHVVLDHFKEDGFSRIETNAMVNDFVDHFKSVLLAGSAIILSGHGRLIPRLKKGGRPVRDLSREESIQMQDTATVTFSKTQKCEGGKVLTKRLIVEFCDKFEKDSKSQLLAELVASTFILLIHRTKSATHRMEVRGLGVFRAKVIEARIGRNPQTGVSTNVPETIYPRFKISSTLRRELTEALK